MIPTHTVLTLPCYQTTAAGLIYLHVEQKLAHLDVKPENILLSGNNQAKLCDFDTVRHLHHSVKLYQAVSRYGK